MKPQPEQNCKECGVKIPASITKGYCKLCYQRAYRGKLHIPIRACATKPRCPDCRQPVPAHGEWCAACYPKQFNHTPDPALQYIAFKGIQ